MSLDRTLTRVRDTDGQLLHNVKIMYYPRYVVVVIIIILGLVLGARYATTIVGVRAPMYMRKVYRKYRTLRFT
jgi:hypothetical protein